MLDFCLLRNRPWNDDGIDRIGTKRVRVAADPLGGMVGTCAFSCGFRQHGRAQHYAECIDRGRAERDIAEGHQDIL